MDRFTYVEHEGAAKLAECDECNNDLFLGDTIYHAELQDLKFCSEVCVMKYHGIIEKELGL